MSTASKVGNRTEGKRRENGFATAKTRKRQAPKQKNDPTVVPYPAELAYLCRQIDTIEHHGCNHQESNRPTGPQAVHPLQLRIVQKQSLLRARPLRRHAAHTQQREKRRFRVLRSRLLPGLQRRQAGGTRGRHHQPPRQPGMGQTRSTLRMDRLHGRHRSVRSTDPHRRTMGTRTGHDPHPSKAPWASPTWMPKAC